MSGRGPKIFLLLLMLIGLGVVFLFTKRYVWHYFRNPEELRLLLKGWGGWAPFGVLFLQLIQIVLAPLPGNVVAFVGGYALGFWPTVVWLMLGVLGGATVAFLLARILGRRLLKLFISPETVNHFDRVVLSRGIFYIFLLLLIPNPLGDWIYYLAGLTGMPLIFFLLLVFVARLPTNILECAVGSTATRFGVKEWISLAAVVIFLAFVYHLNRRRIEKLLEKLTGVKLKSIPK